MMEQVDVNGRGLEIMKKEEMEKRIERWDTKRWEEEMVEKSSLRIYRRFKKDLGKMEYVYDNKPESIILFQARTNSLPLEDRRRYGGKDTRCPVCQEGQETLEHFLLFCEGYGEERINIRKLHRPYIEDTNKIIRNVLFELESHEK